MDLYYNGDKVIQFVDGRVFIDVAVSGCGSNCIYCYVETKLQKQELIDYTSFIDLLDEITSFTDFTLGKSGTIVSLCPNTEPFKSAESTKLVLRVLEKFLPMGNMIQISTKEIIPAQILDFICLKKEHKEQIVFNISTVTITEQKSIEPFAAEFNDRLANFSNLAEKGILSCLYIKPVIYQTLVDAKHYINLVNTYKIKYACIGIYYPEEGKSTCMLLYKNAEEIEDAKKIPTFYLYREFVKMFKESTECTLIHSTICLIALINNTRPKVDLWDKFSELCSACRNCNTNP